ncbi:MAG TPA: hypothetical protein H9671_01840 [Firmicutes bacterium]|nr:hypothetical protein [Bacillota bacterium]
MKKRWTLPVLVLLCGGLLFTGCRTPEAPPATPESAAENLAKGIRLDADITFRDIQAEAQIVRDSSGLYQIELTSPSHLKGLSATFDGQTVQISYLGFQFDVDAADYPEVSLASSIAQVLDEAAAGTAESMTKTDLGYVLTGETDSGSYSLYLDLETLAPISLAVPDLELSCTFSPIPESSVSSAPEESL